MKISLKKDTDGNTLKSGDTCCIFITEEQTDSPAKQAPEAVRTAVSSIDLSAVSGKQGECFYLPLRKAPSLLICGLGKTAELTPDSIRQAGASVVSFCKAKRIKNLHCFTSAFSRFAEEEYLRFLGEGVGLSTYRFNGFKKSDPESDTFPEQCFFHSHAMHGESILKEIKIICDNVNLCRDMVNDASYNSTPEKIAETAKKLASNKSISCKILNKKQLESLKMGLLLAVNQGSVRDALMAVLTYKGNPSDKDTIAIVGKGITFDSGGMNLKTSGHIETMRMDMAGAAVALYTVKTAAELGIKKNILAILPLTENMLSNTSYRPGDVFRSYCGLTVEIGNTDAEGRLILADAIAYTADKLSPSCIIDVATLTGACIVTFGETVAGLLSTDEKLAAKLKKASEKTGERIWQLPLYREFEEDMKSDIADISNMSSEKNAGTIHGAAFLKKFTKDIPWAHIDIAGTAWYGKVRGCYPKNATGWGIRLLTDLLKNWDKY